MLRCSRRITVSILAVPHVNHINLSRLRVDSIDDAVVAHADTPKSAPRAPQHRACEGFASQAINCFD